MRFVGKGDVYMGHTHEHCTMKNRVSTLGGGQKNVPTVKYARRFWRHAPLSGLWLRSVIAAGNFFPRPPAGFEPLTFCKGPAFGAGGKNLRALIARMNHVERGFLDVCSG